MTIDRSRKLNRVVWFSIILVLPLFAAGCLRPVEGVFPPRPGESRHRIYVVNHGWHTGLVIPVDDLSRRARPRSKEFAVARFLEIGWGDEGFYRAQRITPGLVARAVFWPTPTVLHVVAVEFEVEAYFTGSGIIAVDLSEEGLRRLGAFLASSYHGGKAEDAVALGPGIYGRSLFYRATGKYYFPNTCNKWTARALRSAGCPISPFYAIRARNVFRQTEEFGTVLQELRDE